MMITMRTQPNYLAMREAVAQGLIGEITQLGGQKSYRLGERPEWVKHRETFSGIIPYVGIHIMDLARWISGREFVEVMAYASNVSHPEIGDMEDNGCVLAKLDNGASAAFRLDYCRPAAAPTHGDDRLRLAGHLGVIESIAEKVTLITHEAGPQGAAAARPDPVPRRLPRRPRREAAAVHPLRGVRAHHRRRAPRDESAQTRSTYRDSEVRYPQMRSHYRVTIAVLLALLSIGPLAGCATAAAPRAKGAPALTAMRMEKRWLFVWRDMSDPRRGRPHDRALPPGEGGRLQRRRLQLRRRAEQGGRAAAAAKQYGLGHRTPR